MTRSLTSAVKTELATNDIRPVHLITIGFGTPVNITDCSFSLRLALRKELILALWSSAAGWLIFIKDFIKKTIDLEPLKLLFPRGSLSLRILLRKASIWSL